MIILCWRICSARPNVWRWAWVRTVCPSCAKSGRRWRHLKEPEPPKGIKDAFSKLPLLKDIWSMAPNVVKNAPCQEIVWEGEDVDLYKLPIQHCWPEDVAPLVTWGLTVTRGPHKKRQNLGIYRQQLIGKNKLIMRWLSHRGGALDYQEFRKLNPDTPYPVAVVLGCDPATILGAVTPVPDTLSEYQFAGLLRGSRTELVKCIGNDLQVPARAEIVLEVLSIRTKPRWKAHTATTRVITTSRIISPCLRSNVSPCAKTRFTTPPTQANRPMNPPFWAWR